MTVAFDTAIYPADNTSVARMMDFLAVGLPTSIKSLLTPASPRGLWPMSGAGAGADVRNPRRPSIADKLRAVARLAVGASPTERRVFLLEDNEANGLVIEAMLEILGYEEIVWVRSIGEVASYRSSILKGDFSFLIFDISLPDGESFDLLRDLKSHGANLICVYTARTSREDYARFKEIGCAHVFEKPLTLDAFRKGYAHVFGDGGAAPSALGNA